VKGFAGQIGVTASTGLRPLAQATSYRIAFMACGAAGIAIGLTYLRERADAGGKLGCEVVRRPGLSSSRSSACAGCGGLPSRADSRTEALLELLE